MDCLSTRPAALPTGPLARIIANILNTVRRGRLTIVLPGGSPLVFENARVSGPRATVVLKRHKPLIDFLVNGELAFAEAYLRGDWDTPSLTDLFDFVLANEESCELQRSGNFATRLLRRRRHLMNANSRKGSKRNIAYHYDLGNDFYGLWLDETMTYSSALFARGDEDLARAQRNKYRMIAEMAELSLDDRVLEIGCGWGGFSEFAARERGCRIHGLTLSKQQLAHARERYRREGIDDKASASFTDYRDCAGTFDKIVSIEMFEAVGQENWDNYFQTVRERLTPGGIAILQVITIDNGRFDQYRKSADFIQRHIFPGGLLPSPKAMSSAIARNGLELRRSFYFGKDYAKTCRLWRNRFQRAWPEVAALGFDERFKRMWEYYLSYCEAGFNNGAIDVGLFKINRRS